MVKISLKANKAISLDKYPGKWVALNEKGKVAAFAESLEELEKKMKKTKFKKEPVFF